MKTTWLLLLFLPLGLWGQVVDDFSDGDFTENPAWVGMDSCFTVNSNGQLQSAATTAGESWLSLAFDGREEWEWRFWIRENFSPSANNYAEVWLVADSANLLHASKGYYLRFGAAGNQDAIELYRRDLSGDQLVCQGTPAAIASAFKVGVKVNRDNEGRWRVQTDDENMGIYSLEAEGVDDTYPCSGYFGFCIRYTASNAKKFYFDDIYIGPTVVDTVPPELNHIEVRDASHLLLVFNEALSSAVLDTTLYTVVPNVGHPDTVCFASRPSEVLLAFDPPLPINQNCQLRVTGISDLVGNIMGIIEVFFAVYAVTGNDVVINEIMADPSPVVGMPEWEYLELFNTTAFPIDLTGWSLCIGTSVKTFPQVSIDSSGYLILCKSDAVQELSAYGSVCGFSSFSIANAGTTLRLLSPDETLVSEVVFNDTWYHDAVKRDGGWALEQIDPYNPCAGTFNWTASVDPSGGTPGRINSVNAPNAFQPSLERVSMLGDDIVLLWFDQQMDPASLMNPACYQVIELELNPIEVVVNPLDATSVELLFANSFQEGMLYTLSVNGVKNCSGNLIEEGTEMRFGIPFLIGENEILINEILFDPIEPGVDYVELYNPSDKTFDVSELKLGLIKDHFPNPTDTVLKEITEESRLFLPETYLLLSTDGYVVAEQYGVGVENHIDMKSFPSYPNSGGTALLMSRQGMVVDQMDFGESMHDPLLKVTKGVSLERVSWTVPSWQPDNWHSAAASVGFGTPGYANSMKGNEGVLDAEGVTVTPKVFSPDGDGFEDCCIINYSFIEVGYTINTYIFSVDGQLVRHLIKGEMVGSTGSGVWNGLDHRGVRVPLGMYVMVTEAFDLAGTVHRYRNVVSVASQ